MNFLPWQVPLARLLLWTLVLPLFGTVLLGATNPFIGLFIVLGFVLTPFGMLGFIYATGALPSLLTMLLFLHLRRHFGGWRALAGTSAGAALLAALWWQALSLTGSFGRELPKFWLLYMAGIGAASALLLGLDGRRRAR